MKILIICLDNIGDVVMSTILPRALRRKFPDASITYLVKEYSKDVVASHPLVDETIIFNPSWLSDPLKKHFTFNQIVRLVKYLRLRKFDLSLVVNADWKKALLAYLSGIPERIGARTGKSDLFLTHRVPYEPTDTRHMLENNVDLLKTLRIDTTGLIPEIFSDSDAEALVNEFMEKNGLTGQKDIVGIHPFSNNPARAWEIEKFAALADKLVDEKGVSVLFMVRGGDSRADEILRLVNEQKIYISGDANLAQLMAFIKKCSVFVGNDSGPMHLAAALKVPVVAIFGPSNPVHFGPLGTNNIEVRNDLPCSPCSSSPDCRSLECLKSITVGQVYKAVSQLLG